MRVAVVTSYLFKRLGAVPCAVGFIAAMQSFSLSLAYSAVVVQWSIRMIYRS
jgi:hypothetical protein